MIRFKYTEYDSKGAEYHTCYIHAFDVHTARNIAGTLAKKSKVEGYTLTLG